MAVFAAVAAVVVGILKLLLPWLFEAAHANVNVVLVAIVVAVADVDVLQLLLLK